jgi:2,4'-dihydroxyacetophenone dioxygenase
MHTPSTIRHHLVDTACAEWIPLEPGQAFKPIALPDTGPRQLLLRVDPGTVVGLHRHHGPVHGFTLAGTRVLLDPAGHVAAPAGAYVHEPAGTVDSWMAVGDEPCVVHIAIEGAMDTVDDRGEVLRSSGTPELRRIYLAWCAATGAEPSTAVMR